MTARILVLIACFFSASAFIAKASRTEPVMTREALANVPKGIDRWKGHDIGIDEKVLGVLRVDDYLNRVYVSGADSVGIYVGFYQTQRQGATIHSPMNCLPGAGWNPVERSYLHIPVSTNPIDARKQDIQVNRIVIEKGMERQIALYWYQAHGRVVASEYWGKLYTVLDAMRLSRTDGAMVRILSPILGKGPSAEQQAEKLGVDFVQSVYPLLSRSLPE
jgi:EpsI family protein